MPLAAGGRAARRRTLVRGASRGSWTTGRRVGRARAGQWRSDGFDEQNCSERWAKRGVVVRRWEKKRRDAGQKGWKLTSAPGGTSETTYLCPSHSSNLEASQPARLAIARNGLIS